MTTFEDLVRFASGRQGGYVVQDGAILPVTRDDLEHLPSDTLVVLDGARAATLAAAQRARAEAKS